MIKLSHDLNISTPTYGNRDEFIVTDIAQISSGDSANSSGWKLTTNHIGTHIDVPRHFSDDGLTLTDYPDNFWFSDKVHLINIPCNEAVLIDETMYDFTTIPESTEVLLIKTGYENYRTSDKYWNNNPGLAAKLGGFLRELLPHLKFVGFDFISLTSWKYRDEGKISHREFLVNNSILIIEDMKLRELNNPIINIIVSPIFVSNSNGGPATVFANFKI